MQPGKKPKWSLFDVKENEEHILFNSVISEFNDIAGFPIDYYIKTNNSSSDEIYGENTTTTYSSAYRTKLIYEPSEEPQILDVFGMTSDDTIQYATITKTIFERDIARPYGSASYSPLPGDCIRTLWNDKLYEISEMGSEQHIFLAKKLIWEFIIVPYRHSEESDSADDMLFDTLNDQDFPDINQTTESKQLSAYGDNSYINTESNDVSTTPDSGIYGY